MRFDQQRPAQRLAFAGLLAAFTLLLTYVLPIRIPNMAGAYVNLGDIGVYISGMLLGFPYGALAAAIGSAFADLLLGSAIYIAPTFIIKGLMAFVVCFLLKRWKGKKLLTLLCAGVIMPVGYFLFEAVLYGAEVALTGVLPNLAQYIVGVALGVPALHVIERYVQAQGRE